MMQNILEIKLCFMIREKKIYLIIKTFLPLQTTCAEWSLKLLNCDVPPSSILTKVYLFRGVVWLLACRLFQIISLVSVGVVKELILSPHFSSWHSFLDMSSVQVSAETPPLCPSAEMMTDPQQAFFSSTVIFPEKQRFTIKTFFF